MSRQNEILLPPFLKWAGGKRWLAMSYRQLLPGNFNRYVEPFLGGAALYFAIKPKSALLSDVNDRLIECYGQIKMNPNGFQAAMRRHHRQHGHDYYYEVREKVLKSPLNRAAQFLYLNRTCWNGLYRVNLNGEFNVPIGTKTNVIFEGECFSAYARALRVARLSACDFEESIDAARSGDFLFVDPPYTVKHNLNGFAKYNENIFRWSDQIRLRRALDTAARRGVKILLSNAHHESVIDLFGDLGTLHVLNRASVISGNAMHRSRVTEIAITVNYEVEQI